MRLALWWIFPVLPVLADVGLTPSLSTAELAPESNPPLQTVLEIENTARLLAVLLHAGRYVINENQDLFDDPEKGDKGFSSEVFEQQLLEMFRIRSGVDLREIDSVRLPQEAKNLLQSLIAVSKQVVADAQPDINRKGVGYKGFIPAVFGARVASRFAASTGIRLKQTSLTPRNPSNAPDAFEMAALQEFADPSYPREKVISEVTTQSRALRLMFPLYATRRCLVCHGEPKGEQDKTGYPREGLRLGQNAGAISVVIPFHR